jgi:hypothetical protein
LRSSFSQAHKKSPGFRQIHDARRSVHHTPLLAVDVELWSGQRHHRISHRHIGRELNVIRHAAQGEVASDQAVVLAFLSLYVGDFKNSRSKRVYRKKVSTLQVTYQVVFLLLRKSFIRAHNAVHIQCEST